nr:N-acetyl-D-glucosamine kinase isoform X1 [Leptinotarsa decemlineata]
MVCEELSPAMSTCLIGGIEGGATHSHAVIMNSDGEIVGDAHGPGTNHHLIGMPECSNRIASLVIESKKKAGLPVSIPLRALGLSLSGCELEPSNNKFLKIILETHPHLAEKLVVGSDTDGSVAAISNNGGLTCIAGTGSNTLLVNPDGTRAQCGGWGNLLADEGSAWHMSYRAVKYCFDDIDNFEKAPYPIDRVWELVKSHFKIEKQADILDSFYNKFDKSFIASMTKSLSELARDGDKLSQEIFREAGTHLAKSISAVVPKASPELTQQEGGIHVICVGSVWLSWDLLKLGFIDCLRKNRSVTKMTLVRLKTEMGVGAAFMAADKLNLPLARDYSKNYKAFFIYVNASCNGS